MSTTIKFLWLCDKASKRYGIDRYYKWENHILIAEDGGVAHVNRRTSDPVAFHDRISEDNSYLDIINKSTSSELDIYTWYHVMDDQIKEAASWLFLWR